MRQDAWCKPRRGGCAALVALLCALNSLASAQGATPASEQSYPTRPIRLIIAFPPGGGNDIIARYVGTRLTNRVGQQLVIDNRGTEINAILSDPETSKQLAAEGAEVTPWTPAEFGALLKANLERWNRVARESDIKAAD